MLRLEIVNRSGRPVPRAFLGAWVKAMAREAAKKIPARRYRGRELTVVFLAEAAARELNRKWRKRNYATDVLSFDGEGESLGELVICPPVISRQAKEHGVLVREELGYMVLHGFLHLLGYDHEGGGKEEKRMMALQDSIFERLRAKF